MPGHTRETATTHIPPFLLTGQSFALASMRLQAQAYKSTLRYQVEMLGFLKHRLEQDMKFVDDLAASDGLNEAFDVMNTFMQESASDYSSETGRIAKLGSKIASDTTRRMRKDADGPIEDSSAGAVRG